MQFNFITIAINAAKHPAINALPHGLRLIIRLLELHGPQREASVLSGKEATNQWIGNGGLSKYQIQSALEHLSAIEIDGKPLISVSMKFIPGLGKAREIDVSGLSALDMEYKIFFTRYCQETAEKPKAKKAKKEDAPLVKSALVKPALVKPALVKPTRHISMNIPSKEGIFNSKENLDDFHALKEEKKDVETVEIVEPTSQQREIEHSLFKPAQWLLDGMAVRATDGKCYHQNTNKPRASMSASYLPYTVFKGGLASINSDIYRYVQLQDILSDIERCKEDLHRLRRDEKSLFYRIARAMIFEHDRDLACLYIDKDFMSKKSGQALIDRLDIDVYFIDLDGIDDSLIYTLLEKDKCVIILER